MMKIICTLFLFFSCGNLILGQQKYGFENYTKLSVGNINIILSAPHDGELRPSNIPDRTSDRLGNIGSDRRTSLIAQLVSEELTKLFFGSKIDGRPFVVENYLQRYYF